MNFDCEGVERRLPEYLEGKLDDDHATALEAHAGGCDSCAASVELATRLPVRLEGSIAPPDRLRGLTLGRIGKRRVAGGRLRWLVPPAIAAMLVIGFGLTQVRTKSALSSRLESRTPHSLAVDNAWPLLDQLAEARSELEAALGSNPDPRERRDYQRRLRAIDAQVEAVQAIVKEYET